MQTKIVCSYFWLFFLYFYKMIHKIFTLNYQNVYPKSRIRKHYCNVERTY